MIKKGIFTVLLLLIILTFISFTQAQLFGEVAVLHIEYDNNAGNSFELGSAGEVIFGPGDFASGQFQVNYLYSSDTEGTIFGNGTAYDWHEEIRMKVDKIEAIRDILDGDLADQYDDIFITLDSDALQYRLVFDDRIPEEDLFGNDVYFMGKEYTVITADASGGGELELGAIDSRVVLEEGQSATRGGVEVTLESISEAGTNQPFKAKVRVRKGGATSSGFITAGDLDTLAGVKIFVENAVVSASTGTGSAEIIIGADILELESGDTLATTSGGQSSDWQIDFETVTISGDNFFDAINIINRQSYTSQPGSSNAALEVGDYIKSPLDLFTFNFTKLSDNTGNSVTNKTITVQRSTKDLGLGTENVIRIRTDSKTIRFTANSVSRTDNEFFIRINLSLESQWAKWHC